MTNELATIEPTALAAGETATAAQASQAQALVLAQYTMAERHPRRMLDVANKLCDECKRPRFAERARYSIPYKTWDPATRKQITTYVEGLSIRFAEAAIRLLGNVLVQTPIVHDDDGKRIGRVFVVDLERNTVYASDVTVEKVVERKRLRKGQAPLRTRKNSFGDTVYLVQASEQDFRAKWQSELSKAIRTNALRLVPADILEDCEEQLAQTISDADAADPAAALKRLARAFSSIGVPVAELEKFLGHSIETVSPAETERLRGVYTAVSEGVASWREVLDVETTEPPKDEPDPAAELRRKLQGQLKTPAKRPRKAPQKVIEAQHEPPPETRPTPDVEPASPGLTPEQAAQGYELDPTTGEVVPPPGFERVIAMGEVAYDEVVLSALTGTVTVRGGYGRAYAWLGISTSDDPESEPDVVVKLTPRQQGGVVDALSRVTHVALHDALEALAQIELKAKAAVNPYETLDEIIDLAGAALSRGADE